MSVLINMEMPKCCAECDAEGHYENSYGDEYGFFCPFGYKAYTNGTRDTKRLDNCPIIPIPLHGDLIDRDAAAEKIWDDMRFPSNLANAQFFVNELREMPTIIPADEPVEGDE